MTDVSSTITVTVPFTIRHHGGRKQVITPDGRPALAPPRARVDSALVQALGRAFRWRHLLDTGAYATIEEIATAEGINPSYVSRVLRMTLLAPDLVEAALAGRQPEGMTLAWAMGAWPGEWEGQRGKCGRAVTAANQGPRPRTGGGPRPT
jgi:hypothetical protein